MFRINRDDRLALLTGHVSPGFRWTVLLQAGMLGFLLGVFCLDGFVGRIHLYCGFAALLLCVDHLANFIAAVFTHRFFAIYAHAAGAVLSGLCSAAYLLDDGTASALFAHLSVAAQLILEIATNIGLFLGIKTRRE